MANLICRVNKNVTITTHSATVEGLGDTIPVNHFLRVDYGTTPGGPYNVLGTPFPGTNSYGQVAFENLDGLIPEVTYYFVVRELDTDGTTVLDQSSECNFTTRAYEPSCTVVNYVGGVLTVRVCANYVNVDQELQFVYGDTLGGPYPNVGGSVPGNNTLNQCAEFQVPVAECDLIFGVARVTNVPALYEIDWAYAHAATPSVPANDPQTVELRIGPEVDYPANQTLVDTDTVTVAADGASWHHRSGTYAIPLGVDTIHMGFTGTFPATGAIGNMLDSTSIILRRVLPTPLVIGEQIQNGSFESPVITPNPQGYDLLLEGTPGLIWETSAADNLIEIWQGPNPPFYPTMTADSGVQWAELNANLASELFQVVPLAVGVVDSDTECTIASPGAECVEALGVTCEGAILTGTICGAHNMFYAFEYATSPSGPWTQSSLPAINPYGDTDVQSPVSSSTGPLDPNTTYYFRIKIFNDKLQEIFISDPVCQFTTDDCLSWCGGYWDPETCEFVDTANDDYFNCWPEPIRNGFPGEGVEHA